MKTTFTAYGSSNEHGDMWSIGYVCDTVEQVVSDLTSEISGKVILNDPSIDYVTIFAADDETSWTLSKDGELFETIDKVFDKDGVENIRERMHDLFQQLSDDISATIETLA